MLSMQQTHQSMLEHVLAPCNAQHLVKVILHILKHEQHAKCLNLQALCLAAMLAQGQCLIQGRT